MLIAKEGLTVQYNGFVKTLDKGQKLDVRDFDVANKDVKNVERHIINKNPGKFDVKDGKVEDVDKEMEKELRDLRYKVLAHEKEIASLKGVNEQLSEKHGSSVGEIEVMRKQVVDAGKEVTRLTKVNADLEDEITKLRKQLTKAGK